VDEVEALAKEVNHLSVADSSNVREARQQQHEGYDYPRAAVPFPSPSRIEEVRPHDDHHDHHGEHSHIHVTRLDVTCDTRGMSVELEFDGAFNGVVYSKGHFKNRKCRSAKLNFQL